MDVVKVSGLSFKYSYSEKKVLKNISFRIEKGEFVLLAGASGCGKTTLARAIIGLIPQFYEGEYDGRVEVLGMSTIDTPLSKLTSRIGYLFQNPENQIFMTTAERDVAFGLEFRGFSRDEMRKRVMWALKTLGIERLANRRIEELSGGEKQKVALAGILALKPELIILDEPTAYLSPLSSLNLMKTIKFLNQNLEITVILIDHRLDLAVEVANRILVMREGELRLDMHIREAFKHSLSKEYGINVPTLIKIYDELKKRGINIEPPPLTIDEFISVVRGEKDDNRR